MLKTTEEAIAAYIRLDPTVDEIEQSRILRALKPQAAATGEDAERVIPIAEVARRLSKTKKTVHDLCRRGLLKKAQFGLSRSSGILSSSLEKLLSGAAQTADAGTAREV